MSKKILAVDPGPMSSGYAIIDIDTWEIEDHGTADWDALIDIAEEMANNGGVGVAVEKIIMYTFYNKSKSNGPQINNKQVLESAFQTGRLYQAAKDLELEYRDETRSRIIKLITGWNTQGKGNKVTKNDMQIYVQDVLELEKIIQPQHANDAVCAGLALYNHPITKKVQDNGSRETIKKTASKRTKK